MAKVKYTVKENKKVGTHSFYAVPVPNGTLSNDELCKEACDGCSIEPSIMKAAVAEFMKVVQRNVLKGFRCNMGEQFLTVYPNIQCSVKDTEKEKATAKMITATHAKSRLGCTVSAKFSNQFAAEVSWQKVDASGAAVEDDDVTEHSSEGGGASGGSGLEIEG